MGKVSSPSSMVTNYYSENNNDSYCSWVFDTYASHHIIFDDVKLSNMFLFLALREFSLEKGENNIIVSIGVGCLSFLWLFFSFR